jgi:hypothetical protein
VELKTFKDIMDALNRRQARYLLAGGMAVVAHGYGRLTYDIDLVIQLTRDNVMRVFEALSQLGYRPRAPVTAEEFAREEARQGWVRDKGMTVLNLYSAAHATTAVDIFVEEPFDFDETYDKSIEARVEGVPFRYVDLETLIRMKEAAGRPMDLEDIRHLRMIADDEGPVED